MPTALMAPLSAGAAITNAPTPLAQSSSKAAASVPYHAFERLYHYRDRYFLFVDKLHAYILPEDRFVVGDSADFRAFIEAKTGKTVEYI